MIVSVSRYVLISRVLEFIHSWFVCMSAAVTAIVWDGPKKSSSKWDGSKSSDVLQQLTSQDRGG